MTATGNTGCYLAILQKSTVMLQQRGVVVVASKTHSQPAASNGRVNVEADVG